MMHFHYFKTFFNIPKCRLDSPLLIQVKEFLVAKSEKDWQIEFRVEITNCKEQTSTASIYTTKVKARYWICSNKKHFVNFM